MATNRFEDGYDDLFDEALGDDIEVTPDAIHPENDGDLPTMLLPIDVIEMPEAVLIMVDLPGIRPKDLKLGIHGRALHLRATRALNMPPVARPALRERGMGRVERVIPLPDGLDAAGMKAQLTTGVLAIMVPRERTADTDFGGDWHEGDSREPDAPEPSGDHRPEGPSRPGSPWML